ncbi:hypothetical protein [uncultured Mucilaginibacter sp.]|uniref:hypothetical protein n=1 Tax=uncultured Mucilaginibacter sp. TaxID=797541 RepID=UPI0025DB1924|nr:hypothetical protein [uncultured Mucilaginibacter sp.]
MGIVGRNGRKNLSLKQDRTCDAVPKQPKCPTLPTILHERAGMIEEWSSWNT